MTRQERRIIWPIVAAMLALPLAADAHKDIDRPVYVANNGIDSGGCQNPAQPCRTISYALGRVGKSGQVRVADGNYEVSDVGDVFHLVSGVINVRGGFSRADGFRTPGTARSVLIGVPAAYRSILNSRGFQVIADRKGIENNVEQQTNKLLDSHKRLQSSMQAAPCTGGQSGGLDCDQVELLSHVSFSDLGIAQGAGADVWGFVDLNTGREYAIAGFNVGTAFFDVTDAENPKEVGFIDGQRAAWRDIKVHQKFNSNLGRYEAFAYITTDGSSDGLFVADMSNLPHSLQRRDYASDFSSAHNVYATHIDFGTGLSSTGDSPTLIIAGSNLSDGRYLAYTLQNPAYPATIALPASVDDTSGSTDGENYVHDAASVIITDSRKDTQCVNGGTYCELMFDFNERTLDVWDVTVSADPVRLSRTTYPNAAYTHSGWASEDGMTVFLHDEIDERNFGLQTTVRAFSLANLTSPVLVGTYSGPTTAIDHNGFVRGNRYYMSNYSRGLTILDITNPAAMTAVGRLDTYPASDSTAFVGAWGAYPFLHSGNIAISDINSGFFMAKDLTRTVPQGSLGFSANAYSADEGGAIQIDVQRTGGSMGATSVAWIGIPATADAADVQQFGGSLNWADGDTGNKTIVIDTTNDGIAEGLERGLIKLISPTGGATLADLNIASVYISDPGDTASVGFDRDEVYATERGFATAVVVLDRSGSANGAASVDYVLTGGDATPGADYSGITSGTVNWADGDADPKWIEYSISDDGTVEPEEFFELTLSNPVGGTLGAATVVRVNIADGAGSNQAPVANAGASQSVNSGVTVTLRGDASSDPDGDTLSYSWSQIMGPSVSLLDANTDTASFIAPAVTSDTIYQFQLSVSDPRGMSAQQTTNVTVSQSTPAPPPPAGNFGGGGGGSTAPLFLLLLSGVLIGRWIFTRTDAS